MVVPLYSVVCLSCTFFMDQTPFSWVLWFMVNWVEVRWYFRMCYYANQTSGISAFTFQFVFLDGCLTSEDLLTFRCSYKSSLLGVPFFALPLLYGSIINFLDFFCSEKQCFIYLCRVMFWVALDTCCELPFHDSNTGSSYIFTDFSLHGPSWWTRLRLGQIQFSE